MNSLKKSISFMLVLVMALGMFSVSANFTDLEEVQYKEAVEVMAGLDVINGMGDGTFAPTGNLTRAQAAKMVTYAVLGHEIAELLPVKSSSFSDVDDNFEWAIPSIEYLVSEGIVVGMGDGTFRPNEAVTGNQLGKMLLVALDVEGAFEGNSWELNTAIAANKIKLFNGSLATNFSNAATREEAALYCFNALRYSPNGTSVEKIWGITGWENGLPVYGWIEVPGVATGSIADEVYGLSKKEIDENGIAGYYWTVANGDIISSFYSTEAVIASLTDLSITGGTLYSKYSFENLSALELVVNGYARDTVDLSEKIVRGGTTKLADMIEGYNLQGSSVSFLDANTNGKIDKIVITYQTLAKVTDVVEETAKEDRKIVLEVYGEETEEVTISHKGYAEGDYVLITTNDAKESLTEQVQEAIAMSKATVVEGKVSAYATSTVTVDGKAYSYDNVKLGFDTIGNYNFDANYNFFLNSNGYIIGLETVGEVASATNYGMLLSAKTVSILEDGAIVEENRGELALSDGSVVSIVMTNEIGELVGKTVSYTMSDDKYTLNTVEESETVVTDISAITTGEALLDGTNDLYANNKTKFIVANYVFDTKTQSFVPDNTVTMYTGIANVPSYDFTGKTLAVALDTSAKADKVAELVFIFADVNRIVSDSYIYVTGDYTVTGEGYVVETIVKGEASSLTLANAEEFAKLEEATLYSQIVLSGKTIKEATKAQTTETSLQNIGGLLFVSGNFVDKTIADDTVIYVMDTENNSVTVKTFAEVTTLQEGAVHVLGDKEVTAIYLVK